MLKVEMIQLRDPETGRVTRVGYIARNHATGEAQTINGRAFWGSEPGIVDALARAGYLESATGSGEYLTDVCVKARKHRRGMLLAHFGGV